MARVRRLGAPIPLHRFFPWRSNEIAFSMRRCLVFVVFAESRGLLDLGDARLAAAQFAYLVLAIPQDRAQFCPQERPSPAERDRPAAEAVRVFLAAYQGSHQLQI